MASDQERSMDRRSALGRIGKASAVAAAVGIPAAAVARSGKGNLEVASVDVVRGELRAGAGAVPFGEILPDGVEGDRLERASKVLDHRIGEVARLLTESGTAQDNLVTGKHSMNRARREMKSVLADLSSGKVDAAAARAKVERTFELYFAEMKALGA